ncbi:MAG: lipid A biosynthesis acyltransferase [Cellvibrionaceae bacterium]|nr:lipid A biosynthesis acyltransferase [Cellvibrionaceae bacterium]|tara:strand:+ start:711 stop:1619 length:909 start_codon:yes stop_codon:yes gene_type:complete
MEVEDRFSAPRYWPTWIGISLLRLWAKLPWSLQCAIAKLLAFAAYRLAKRRRNIVNTNLKLAFPEWDATERENKTKQVLFDNMLGLVETAKAYSRPPESFRSKTTFKNVDILQSAIDQGRGVLLLGAHYSHLDFGGSLLSMVCAPNAIYRPNNNALMDRYIKQGRLSFIDNVIERSDMRTIAKTLKQGKIVWYPPDQDYGKKHSVYAPFFGVNAASIIATSRLVRFNQSPVVVMSVVRHGNSDHYTLEFHALDEDFPSGDDIKDATIVNQALERCIRKAPTQYMWTHRRFKTQPEGRAKFYK